MMRITIGLLQYLEKDMLSKDIVELSIMMKDVRTEWFQSIEEQKKLFYMIIALNDVQGCASES